MAARGDSRNRALIAAPRTANGGGGCDSPRSDSDDRPCVPLLVLKAPVVRPVLPCHAGSSIRVSKTFGLAFFSRSAADSDVVGVGWLKPRAAMPEPETVTTSILSAACAGAGAGVTVSATCCCA
jgi:hypothetical protein